MNKNTLILTKTKFLKNYKIENIDENVIQKILSISLNESKSLQGDINLILRLLNCFYFIKNENLNYIDLSNKKTSIIFGEFIYFLNEKYINLNKKTLQGYKYNFNLIIKKLSFEFKHFGNFKIKEFKENKFDKNKIKFLNSFHIVDPQNKKSLFLNIVELYPLFSLEELFLIESNAQKFCSVYGYSQLKHSLGILKKFSTYLKNNKFNKSDFKCSKKSFIVIKSFCKYFFEDAQKNNFCLHSQIRYWNSFKILFNHLFYSTKLINLKEEDYPIAPSRDKNNSLINIKNSNGIKFKRKLLTDIPLTLNDNEAIDYIFSKIINDIKITQNWYNYYLNLFDKYVNSPIFEINEKSFELSKKEILKNTPKTNIKDFLFTSGIPSHSTLEFFMFGLVDNHPEITESFLINFKLFNDNNEMIGLKETDAGTYLTGNKFRKGSRLAEQNILLDEKSKKIINLLIKSTEKIRSYLKNNNNDDWKYLFIGISDSFYNMKPRKKVKTLVPAPSNMKLIALKERIEYFNKIEKIKHPENFVYNLTLTKLRASKGVEAYLKSENSSEMARVLGHDKYKPDLLSRYLPDIILDFFQSRWIRIFQKGIICESLKDSKYLFKASKFKNIEDLSSFLEKHTLNLESNKEKNLDNKEILISINENILTALFSIEKAVEISSEKVNSKSLYWFNFSKKLKKEINNNNKYITFRNMVKKAELNVDPKLFKEIIYV